MEFAVRDSSVPKRVVILAGRELHCLADLLHRDVANVCGWFARRGVACDPEATFAALLAEA